jgi:hypothetical protein
MFSERIGHLREAGFALENLPDGRVKAVKHGVAAVIGEGTENHAGIERAGIVAGDEIASLLSGGYQMFLETPSGKRMPAQAEQLRALHQFEDDLKEALGIDNLYNTSLGTVSRSHAYDRVEGYSKAERKPWEKKVV